MKYTKKILSVILAVLVFAAVFSACNASVEDVTEAQVKLADCDWATVQIPDGYTQEDDSIKVILDKDGTDGLAYISIATGWTGDDETMEDIYAGFEGFRDYERGEDFKMGNYTWTPIHYTQDGYDAVLLYAVYKDDHYIELDSVGAVETDDALKTVLESLVITE